MKYIDVERVRKESANVLVVEDANPGSPHLSSVYVDDLCVEIKRLRELPPLTMRPIGRIRYSIEEAR